jgi:sugar/nucleoside kinase (ribokinase family)
MSMSEPAKANSYEILGVGSPYIDQVILVTDEYLKEIGASKGSMVAIEHSVFNHIVKHSGFETHTIVGGSCANAIKGLAKLGHSCAFVGKVGQDEEGALVQQNFLKMGIIPLLAHGQQPTSQLACLVTPDGERTFRNFMGATREFSAQDIKPEMFKNIRLAHIEGYNLLNEGLTEEAMRLAKEAGAKITFDLANYSLVEKFKEQLMPLISCNVDILFANGEEARRLTGLDPHEACSALKDIVEIVIILLGAQGCVIGHDMEVKHYPAYPVKPLDTTGAGDLFTAGFLHGYLTGQPIKACAHYGALAGAAIVKVLGAELPDEDWVKLSEEILHSCKIPLKNE